MLKTNAAIVFLAFFLCSATANAVVTFDWATVGNPGNGADNTGFGAVPYAYRISKTEVTNAQYTEFLNAVDTQGTNTLALYSTAMSSGGTGGIIFNSDGLNGAKYQVNLGRDNNPVNFVSFFDAMRFVNWLQNGQGSGSTETGVYTIGNGVNETRNPNATYFIPSENEWYKAAYHKNDSASGNYWEYATSADAVPFSVQPPGGLAPTPANSANIYKYDGVPNGYDDGFAATGSWNFFHTENYLTDVGAYTASVSPYGTLDQTGNVAEWNEGSSSERGARGGSFEESFTYWNSAGTRWLFGPGYQVRQLGFRVASLEPKSGDFNSDGTVDAADYVIWRKGLANGAYTQDEYNTWRSNFGAPDVEAVAAAHSFQNAPIPEPTTIAAVFLALALAPRSRRLAPSLAHARKP